MFITVTSPLLYSPIYFQVKKTILEFDFGKFVKNIKRFWTLNQTGSHFETIFTCLFDQSDNKRFQKQIQWVVISL